MTRYGDIIGTLGAQHEIIKSQASQAEEAYKQVAALQEGQFPQAKNQRDFDAIRNNNPLEPHTQKVKEVRQRQEALLEFEKQYRAAPKEIAEVFDKKFKKFEERNFRNNELYGDHDHSNPAYEKIQKELASYNEPIRELKQAYSEGKTIADFQSESIETHIRGQVSEQKPEVQEITPEPGSLGRSYDDEFSRKLTENARRAEELKQQRAAKTHDKSLDKDDDISY